MLRTKQAKLLTKKERRHLTEMGIHSLATLRRTRAAQIAQARPDVEPCFECKTIARKLGID